MSFIKEAQSVRSKLHLDSMNPFMLVGIAAVGIVVLVAALGYGSSLFTSGGLSSDGAEGITISSNDSSEEQLSSSQDENQTGSQSGTLFVHVGGAVKTPGLYELDSGARVKDAIDNAGGLNDKADIDSVNLAELLTDGQQIVIAEKGVQSTSSGAGTSASSGTSAAGAAGKVNINTASSSQLQSLSGVGEATAQKIIAYRESQGRFNKIEDLKKVSGIGDKKFEALKDHICV